MEIMIRLMAKANIFTPMDQAMKVNGRMICSMERAKKDGRMVVNMKVIMYNAHEKEKDCIIAIKYVNIQS
jgi:hypothetical protein